jgi:hypothetical protein
MPGRGAALTKKARIVHVHPTACRANDGIEDRCMCDPLVGASRRHIDHATDCQSRYGHGLDRR